MTDWLEGWRSLLPGDEHDRRRIAQGRAFNRSGRVTNVRIAPGRLSGHVQGSRATPYLVEVLLPALDDAAWATAVEIVAGQLRFGARLLAGQLPAELPDALAQRGVALFGRPGELDPRCACGEAPRPCAHLVALWDAASERFAEDPFAFLRLRGRGRERLLAELAVHRRALRSDGSDDGVALRELSRVPYDEAPDDLSDLRLDPVLPPLTPAGSLRLLGDPAGWAGGVSAFDLFAPMVVDAARAGAELTDS